MSKDSVIDFGDIIANYNKLQDSVMADVKKLASKMSSANPGQFILLQFKMSQVTQVGESISNLISQVNSVINNTVRNQKSS